MYNNSMKVFLIPLAVWFISLLIKILSVHFTQRRHVFYYGGWPSMHTTLVSALTTMLGFEVGFSSPVFAIAIIFSLIVISDSLALRSVVGEHSRVLNQKHKATLPEDMGHQIGEVVAGLILGVGLTLIFNQIF